MSQTAAQAIAFAKAHPAVVDWIGANMERNNFAASLAQQLDRDGGLSEKQITAVLRNVQVKRAHESAPVLDVSAIEAKFETARANQVKRPMMRLDTFVFKAAASTGRNPGAIYVTDANRTGDDGKGLYLGKVMGSKFLRVTACTAEEEARIVAAASNPDKAAEAYGQRTGNCSICGRELTAEESLAAFVGPICARKYGM